VRGTTKRHMPPREKGALAHAGTRLKKNLCTTITRYAQWPGRAHASDCEAYQWGAKMEDAALTAIGFEGRGGFQYNYDLCLMAEYGPRANDALN
jgi:6-phosphofructokinase